MIPLVVFYVHIVGFAAAITRRWQDEGPVEAALTLGFLLLIFFVGWSITSFLLKLVMPSEGFGPAFDRDAASLVVLTVVEGVFYRVFFRGGAGKAGITEAGS